MGGFGVPRRGRRRVLETRVGLREETAFSKWISRKSLSVAVVAARIGVTPKTVYYWATGYRVPDLVSAFRVEEVTEGEVSAMSFLATKAAKRVHLDLINHSSRGDA